VSCNVTVSLSQASSTAVTGGGSGNIDPLVTTILARYQTLLQNKVSAGSAACRAIPTPVNVRSTSQLRSTMLQ
jgi:hypothetical protein